MYTPFDRETRRHRAQTALGNVLVAAADVDRLIAILAATRAESAVDRRDDLCAVYVRGPLSDAEVMEIDATPEGERAAFRAAYGEALDAKKTWRHDWLFRTVRREGQVVTMSREAWLRENALAILRDGGVEVRIYGGEWTRVAPEADYKAIAMVAVAA
jgi:hypothetical protein